MIIADKKGLHAAKDQLARYKISLDTHNPKYWKDKGFGANTIEGILRGLELDYAELKEQIALYEQFIK